MVLTFPRDALFEIASPPIRYKGAEERVAACQSGLVVADQIAKATDFVEAAGTIQSRLLAPRRVGSCEG